MDRTPVTDLADADFARATSLRPDPEVPGRFHVEYEPEWLSLRGVHGGFQAAVAVRAVEAVSLGRAVRTLSASFLRPAEVGPAVLDVEVLRHTRAFTTALVTVSQQGRAVLSSRITSVAATAGHHWATPVTDRPAPLADAVPFTPPMHLPNFGKVQLLLDPHTIPGDGEEGDGRIAGYLRPLEGHQADAAWLTAAGDWFPPSAFRRVAPPIGGVSVDYSVHLHRTVTLDPEEWLTGVFITANSIDGLALEHGTLSAADGLVVAETFHTRWTG
jgi:acyl-CoA thioesterase